MSGGSQLFPGFCLFWRNTDHRWQRRHTVSARRFSSGEMWTILSFHFFSTHTQYNIQHSCQMMPSLMSWHLTECYCVVRFYFAVLRSRFFCGHAPNFWQEVWIFLTVSIWSPSPRLMALTPYSKVPKTLSSKTSAISLKPRTFSTCRCWALHNRKRWDLTWSSFKRNMILYILI